MGKEYLVLGRCNKSNEQSQMTIDLQSQIPWTGQGEHHCPRCGASLHCQSEEIAKCACSQLVLSEATRTFLLQTRYNCLCNNCLMHYEQLSQLAQVHEFPLQKKHFIEGTHFYQENGFWVFTELYHYLRGYCCESGCRHCPYGFIKK